MVKPGEVGKRLRARRAEGLFNLIFGGLTVVFALMVQGPFGGLLLLIGAGFLCGGIISLVMSRQLPTKEIMQLAESRNGLVTLSELTTTLDLDPVVAAKSLKKLQGLGIATQRWQEFRRNLWEFPDYVQLPLDRSIELAQRAGGRLTVKELVAEGYSVETARQTLEALTNSGLAQQDEADPRAVLVEASAATEG